jgi:hypothetical protein
MRAIPLKMFQTAVDHMKEYESGKYRRFGIYGNSKGAGMALLAASVVPDISLVIAASTFGHIMQGSDKEDRKFGRGSARKSRDEEPEDEVEEEEAPRRPARRGREEPPARPARRSAKAEEPDEDAEDEAEDPPRRGRTARSEPPARSTRTRRAEPEDYCRKNGLMGLSDKQLRAYPNAWRSWPRNYDGNYGDGSDLPLWNGLARSLNTIAVRVGDLVGASNIFNFVYNTLQLNTLDPTNDVGLAQMVMGSQTKGVTPMALAAAFQIFYDGEYTTPHLYTRVLDREGNIYLENNATSYQALTPDTAYVMNRLLKNVLFSSVGTASGRYPNSNGMEAFGKTGTASDEKDLWFVGGTPYYVTAVWWGYDAPYDMTKTLSKQQAKTRTCVMAWKAYMEQVQANLPYKAFPTSAGVVERRYCTQSGLLAGAGCPSTAVGYYRADDLPDTCTYSHAAPQAAAPAAARIWPWSRA